ncbi:MAG: cytochrome P450 [Holophagales bacterium]|nr:cytochrome P450 [Holophagales bacterium]MXW02343.1 cytochrome P450 [Holophagales bacterium]
MTESSGCRVPAMDERSSRRSCPHAAEEAVSGRVRRASEAERRTLPLPPGPDGRRLRNLIAKFRDYPAFAHELYREYGDIVLYRMTWLGKCCLIFDPALMRAVLDVEQRELIRQQISVDLARLRHGGMNTLYGEPHEARVAIVRDAFSADRMYLHADHMAECVRARVESWRDGQRIDVLDEMLRLCLGFVLDVLVGKDMEADVGVALELRRALKTEWIVEQVPLLRRVRRLPLPVAKRGDRAFETTDDLIYRAIDRSENPLYEGHDLVSHIVRRRRESGGRGPYASNEAIRDELILSLNSAGPAAHLFACGIEHLARRPWARTRLAAEAEAVLAGRPVRGADADRLPYATATVKEILRLRMIGQVAWKRAADDLVVDGYLIPRGSLVHPCFGVIHRRPEWYEAGEEFRPERWLDESGPVPTVLERPQGVEYDSTSSGPFPYHPFSYGSRECPGGVFMFPLGALLLAAIAQRWRLERVADGESHFIFRPIGGPMRVKKPYYMMPRAREPGPRPPEGPR